MRSGRRGADGRRSGRPVVAGPGRGAGRSRLPRGPAYPGAVPGRPRRSPLGRALWVAAELAMTAGVLVLLLVAHQLWWTNVQAHAAARREVAALERQWTTPGPSAATTPGDDSPVVSGTPTTAATAAAPPSGDAAPAREDLAFAVIRIPRIGVTAPIAEGTSKPHILNHGYVGHYPGTAGPGQTGNFALAGHRNTHGEPFRYINRLRPGDTVEIETATYRYTYVIRRTLPQTYASDGTVVAPVPYSSVHPGARMSGVDRYITLTTCTPEFTSRYRLIVWGVLTGAHPR